MPHRRLLALCLVAAAARAAAEVPAIHGQYETPLGRVEVSASGAGFVGTLLAPSGACPFRVGEQVLRATLLDDSLAGQLRVCLRGKGCGTKEGWESAVLLVSGDRLSGAVHVAEKGCRAPVGRQGGIALVRVGKGAAPPPTTTANQTATSGSRGRAQAALRDGAAWLREGNFERARRRFLEAIELDRSVPEAYNGVGVTYRMRDDLPAALDWYKQALAIDPDFGDAYYNMACVYALQGEKALALRYLQIAALNGYATAEGIDQDPDLEPLRAEPAYRALLETRM